MYNRGVINFKPQQICCTYHIQIESNIPLQTRKDYEMQKDIIINAQSFHEVVVVCFFLLFFFKHDTNNQNLTRFIHIKDWKSIKWTGYFRNGIAWNRKKAPEYIFYAYITWHFRWIKTANCAGGIQNGEQKNWEHFSWSWIWNAQKK